MKSIFKFDLTYLSKHKLKTAKQIVLLAVCVLLVIVQIMSAYNIFSDVRNEQLIAHGQQDAILINYDENSDTFNSDRMGTMYAVGSVINNNANFNNKMSVGYCDENAAKIAHLNLVEGTFPVNEDEIVVEKNCSSVLRKTLNVGDELSLDINLFDENSTIISKKFKICGIIDSYSDSQWKGSGDSLLPAVILNEKLFESLKTTAVSCSLVCFEKATQKELLNDDLLSSGVCNGYFLSNNAVESFDVGKILNFTVFALVFFTGIICLLMLISNALTKSMDIDRNIGLYKVVGYSNKDLVKVFLVRELLYLIPSILFGSIFGPISFAIIFKEKSFSVKIVVAAVFVALLIVFAIDLLLTYAVVRNSLNKSVVESLRNDKNIVSSKDLKIKFKNPLMLWGLKNYNANKFSSTTLSFVLVFAILFGVFGIVTMDFTDKKLYFSAPEDIQISAYDGTLGEYIGVPVDPDFGIEEADVEYILQSPDVKTGICTKLIYFNKYGKMADADPDDPSYETWCSDEYKESLKKYGYDEYVYMRLASILCANDEELKRIGERSDFQGEINLDKLNSGEETICFRLNGAGQECNIGDVIDYTVVLNGKRIDIHPRVAGIVNFMGISTNESVDTAAYCGNYICGNGLADKLNIKNTINFMYIMLNNSEHDDIDIRLDKLSSSINSDDAASQMLVEEHYQSNNSTRALSDALKQTYGFVSIILLVFSMLAFVLTMNMQLERQKKVFASMRATGMTKKNMFLTVFTDNLFKFLFALVLCIVLTIVVVAMICVTYGVVSLLYPAVALLIYTAVFVVEILVASAISVNRFFKKSIAEQLRA